VKHCLFLLVAVAATIIQPGIAYLLLPVGMAAELALVREQVAVAVEPLIFDEE
jgi:hypothetical protein